MANRAHSVPGLHDAKINAGKMYGMCMCWASPKGLASGRQDIVLQDHMAPIKSLNSRIKYMDDAVDCMAAESRNTKLLMGIAGIDAVISLTPVLEIGSTGRLMRRYSHIRAYDVPDKKNK